MSSSLPSFLVWLAFLLTLQSKAAVSKCSITSSAAAVVAGDNLSLTCNAKNGIEYIAYWKLGSDTTGAPLLYQAIYHDGSGTVTSEVTEGYLVNDPNPYQVILTIPNAIINQSDYYYCCCNRLQFNSTDSAVSAFVSVLASEPTFSNATEILDRETVTFTCSVSFNGIANTSITIEDSSGNVLNKNNYVVTSKELHNFSLDYNTTANSNSDQEYSCNVTLTNDTSKTMIYTKKVNASVEWDPVRSVKISPVESDRCINNKQCAVNQTLNCTAEGNPKPVAFLWKVSLVGRELNDRFSDQLTLSTVGNYTIQCMSFNLIGNTNYSSTSDYFKTEVTAEGPVVAASQENTVSKTTAIIVGVVVGVGGAIIIVIIIVVFLFCKRKKSGTVCCNPDDKETRNSQSVELSKHHNDNNSFSTDNGVQNKSFVKSGNDEVTLVENDLYSGKQSKTQIDPSDGGYASVNEVMQQSK